MSATKITGLDQITYMSSGDLVPIVHNPAGSPTTNKITIDNFFSTVSVNTHFSGNSVSISNTTLLTFDNGVQLGANIEGDNALGFDVFGPATLDYMGMSYGVNPANGYASYLTMNKTGSDLNRDHQLNLQVWRGTANGADGGLTQWVFNSNGTTNIPGPILPQYSISSFTDSTVSIDITKMLNKLTPHGNSGNPHYYLADGTEGQIMYLVPNSGGTRAGQYTTIRFAHCRFSDVASGQPSTITDFTDNGWWLPFNNGGTCVTIIFTDGAWNLPHNNFD
jgi:hypothetical protein